MPATYKFINLQYLTTMADSDKEMEVVMLRMLLEELPEEIQKMNAQLADKSWEELRRTSHKMKSTLAFVGYPPMTQANKIVEKYCKTCTNLNELPELVEQLNKYLKDTLPELEMALQHRSK